MLDFDSTKQNIRDDLVEKQRSTGCEHYWAINKNGTVYKKKGLPTSINPEPALESAYADPTSHIVYHHSHPDERTLSLADLRSIGMVGSQEIWAHCVGGCSYGATLQQGVSRPSYQDTIDKINGTYQYEYISFELPSVSADDFYWFSHLAINRALVKRGFIEFYCSMSPAFQAKASQAASSINLMEDWFYNLIK